MKTFVGYLIVLTEGMKNIISFFTSHLKINTNRVVEPFQK